MTLEELKQRDARERAIIGRAITDIRGMCGEFDSPENNGDFSTLRGTVPASELGDYPDQVASYTQGTGRMQIALDGYQPCHNTDAVVAELAYDPEADLDNPTGSVFCSHGAGFNVPWNEVHDYMHLEGYLKKEQEEEPEILMPTNPRPAPSLGFSEDKELQQIFEKTYGPVKRKEWRPSPVVESKERKPEKKMQMLYPEACMV